MSKSDEQIQRESSRKLAAEARKKLPEAKRAGHGTADWANADAALVHGLVCSVAVAGGAVRFGYTRDGGAYSIGLYLGDDSKTYYCNEQDGINEELRELIGHFER